MWYTLRQEVNVMTQFIRLLSAALCLALVLMGCAREPAEESSDLEPVSYVALPGIDLSALLTTEQVAAGLPQRFRCSVH